MKYWLSAVVALAALSGCASPVVVEFNDREIEFEELSSATFPEGAGVTRIDGETIHVKGDEPIRVNGVRVYADADSIRIGKRELKIAKGDRVVVDSSGDVRVVDRSRTSSVSFSGLLDKRAKTKTRSTGASESPSTPTEPSRTASQEDSGLLSFLR